MSSLGKSGKLCSVVLLGVCLSTLVRADDEEAIKPALDMVKEKYAIDMKKLFSTKCSWCHQGMGMKQADGPKLGGTLKSREQVIKQIKSGKSPMPGFASQLKENEIEALADYIKALPGK